VARAAVPLTIYADIGVQGDISFALDLSTETDPSPQLWHSYPQKKPNQKWPGSVNPRAFLLI